MTTKTESKDGDVWLNFEIPVGEGWRKIDSQKINRDTLEKMKEYASLASAMNLQMDLLNAVEEGQLKDGNKLEARIRITVVGAEKEQTTFKIIN